jgi:cytidylate kinase
MDYKGVREVAAAPIRIIEGSYSHHPILGKYGDVCIFSDIDSSTQLERIKKRNGEKAAAVFNEKWIPMEEAYIRTYQIDTSADITI